MIIISPDHHPEADKVWRGRLGEKPNGARTLGAAQAKYLKDIFSSRYDMMVTYASDYPFEIPERTKHIAVMVHQNFPWADGFRSWQRVNAKLSDYQVDYFVNEHTLEGLIKEVYPRVFYLPRFIDTGSMPHSHCTKTIDTLWFGNRWNEFGFEFECYKQSAEKPYWITHGELGVGEEKIKPVSRDEAMLYLAKAKKVWAIGVSQLEAQFYDCDIVSYRGGILPYYDQNTIQQYAKELIKSL